MPIPKGPNCFGDVMGEFKRGELHSGKDGPKVKSKNQAKAIASSMCNNSEDAEPEHGCGCSHTEKEKMDKKKKMMALGYSEEAVDAVLDDMEAKYGFKEKMAGKDYDGDGKIESSKDEYLGSRKKAIEEDSSDNGEKKGLWANIHAKRERIKRGSGERMRKPGEKGAPSEKDLKDSQSKD